MILGSKHVGAIVNVLILKSFICALVGVLIRCVNHYLHTLVQAAVHSCTAPKNRIRCVHHSVNVVITLSVLVTYGLLLKR